MNRHAGPSRRRGDAGFALIELVLALGLTALAATAIMTLIVSSGRIADRVSADDPRAGVAVQWLTEDIQRATAVAVDTVGSGGTVTAITLEVESGDVSWRADDAAVVRTGPETADMVVVDTTASVGVTFTVLDGHGAEIDPTDTASIAACGWLVRFELADSSATTRTRTVGLRRVDDGGAPC